MYGLSCMVCVPQYNKATVVFFVFDLNADCLILASWTWLFSVGCVGVILGFRVGPAKTLATTRQGKKLVFKEKSSGVKQP